MKTNFKKNGGFTLVELIVVIAILAILAAVAIPAYSGYIEKANRAGDEQLLAAINKAYASACTMAGKDIYLVDNAVIRLTTDKTVDVGSVKPYGDSFGQFFAGNENTAFKVIAGLYFHPELHQFVEMSESMSNLLNILTGEEYEEAILALQGSAFHEMGYDVLAGKIDNAAGMLSTLYVSSDSALGALLGSDGNLTTLYGFLSEDEGEASELYDNLFEKKLKELEEKYPDKKGSNELRDMAEGDLLANAAILTAAKNSQSAIDEEFKKAMANGSAVSILQEAASQDGNASDETIAQAAFAYAMYTSFQKYAGNPVTEDVNIADVYTTLESTAFQDYMKNHSENDQKGYFGAMDLISGSAENADNDMKQDILMNGFNSDELVALIQGATK